MAARTEPIQMVRRSISFLGLILQGLAQRSRANIIASEA